MAVFKFNTTIDPAAAGGIENPTLLYSKPVSGISIGHSSMFSYDGRTIEVSRNAVPAHLGHGDTLGPCP